MDLTRISDRVAALQDRQLADPRRRNAVRARLLAPARSPKPRLAWVLAAAALAGILGFFLGRADRAPTAPVAGPWQVAPDTAPVPLRFADGSEVTLEPRARARVTELGEHGARVLLERGGARVAVVHRAKTRWTIEAGPFEVAVTGTRFDVAWEPGDAVLSVAMEEGRVEISGCGVSGRAVAGRESVKLACKTDQASDVPPPPPVAPAPVAPPTASSPAPPAPLPAPPSAAPPAPSANAPAPSSAAPEALPPAPDWRRLAALDRYPEAFAAVDGARFDEECARADAASLLTLANVARLTAHTSHAERALLALRKRFPATPSAAIAAFDLGTLSVDQRHDASMASRWFKAYLDEARDGPLAREALGRLIETRAQSGDRAGARAAARDYLARYPTGPRAELARSTLGDE
jgi:TolA-binding protein